MNERLKVLNILILLVTACGLTIFVGFICFWVAEQYFFDRLIYQKSPWHGYAKDVSIVSWNRWNVPPIAARVADLKTLTKSEDFGANFFPEERQKYKVVLIGDSFAFGMGVRDGQRFPKLLEKKLSKHRSTRVYILAQPGDDIIENYTKFLLAEKYIDPDLVIMGMHNNDLIELMDDKYPLQGETYKNLQLECPGQEFDKRALDDHMSAEVYAREYLVPSYSKSYTNICYLQKAVHDIVEKKPTTIFYTFDTFKDARYCDINHNDLWSNVNFVDQTLEEVLKTNSPHVLGLSTTHQSFKRVSAKESHPSKETHELFAEQLYQEIVTNSEYGFTHSYRH